VFIPSHIVDPAETAKIARKFAFLFFFTIFAATFYKKGRIRINITALARLTHRRDIIG